MRRTLLLLSALLALAPFGSSQQADVRVRLLSLYHLRQLRIVPLDQSATMRPCASCAAKKIPGPTEITLQEKSAAPKLLIAGESASDVRIEGRVRIEAQRVAPLEIAFPVKITVIAGEIAVIASMPMEDYVAAAVQGESSGQMPPEALKALAITVRTYAVRFRGQHSDAGFDYCDSTHCQHATLGPNDTVKQAVAATRGQILWDRGRPAMAFHHQDCGGQRAAADEVWPDRAATYLDSRLDPYCVREKRDWKSTIERIDMMRALAASGIKISGRWDRLLIADRTKSGRAKMLRFDSGASRGPEISASSFRFAVGRAMGWNLIKSDLYDISQSGAQITFTGRGSGHGVGLCQVGAIEMAREDKSYRDILAFYFFGTKIGVAAQGIDWKTIRGTQLDLLVTGGDGDQLLTHAEALLRDAERLSGLRVKTRPSVQVFPTVELFRNTTGEPGWVAASTRRRTIRLQPPDILRSRGELDSSLRHEFLHFVIESNTHARLPLWFREGLVLYLGDEPTSPQARRFTDAQLESALQERRSPEELRVAYAASKARVAALVSQYGRAKVLSWLTAGIPQ